MNGKVKRRHREIVPVCSVGGCWEDRAPGSEFCARGPAHAISSATSVKVINVVVADFERSWGVGKQDDDDD